MVPCGDYMLIYKLETEYGRGGGAVRGGSFSKNQGVLWL